MKRVKLINFTFISFAFILAAVSPTFSQVAPDVWRSRVNQQEMLKIIGRSAVNRELLNKKRAANKAAATKPNAAKTLTATGPLSFKFSNQYILPALAVKEIQGTTAEKTQLAELLKGYIDNYKATAQRDGFAANDLAFAYTNFFVQNFFAYTNIKCSAKLLAQKNEPPDCLNVVMLRQTSFETDSAMTEQFRAALSAKSETAALSDYEKQLLAETLAIKTGVLLKKHLDAINNKAIEPMWDVKRESQENIETLLGVSAAKVYLTEEGIQF